jgi:hypothetical protein
MGQPSEATVARVVGVLRRQGTAGLRCRQVATIIGISVQHVTRVFTTNQHLFEPTGSSEWHAPYWRLKEGTHEYQH